MEFQLDSFTDKTQLVSAVRDLSYRGSYTNTSGGLTLLQTRLFDPTGLNQWGDRSDVPNVAIVITDGASNEDEHNTVPFADQVMTRLKKNTLMVKF